METVKSLYQQALGKFQAPINPMDRWLPGCPYPFAGFVAIANGEPFYNWVTATGNPLNMTRDNAIYWLRKALGLNAEQTGVVSYAGSQIGQFMDDFFGGTDSLTSRFNLPWWAWVGFGVLALVGIGYAARSFK